MDTKKTTSERINERLSKINNKEPTTKKVILSSSMIKDVETSSDNKLVIKFNTGAIYKFKDLPEQVAYKLIEADSAGKFFNEHIKNKYEYEKVASIQKRIWERLI